MDIKTNILFVDDDPNLLSGLRRMLRACRNQWTMHFAVGGAAALEVVAKHNIDVIVSDMKMPEIDGAELLTTISRSHPEIVRLILSGQAEHEKIVNVVGVAHQFLSKPCDSDDLQSTIGNICDAKAKLTNLDQRVLVTQIGSIPCAHQNYLELTSIFEAGENEFDRAKEVIAKDVGLSVKVMQLVSSSFFGSPQPKCDIPAACDMLGFELLSQLFFESNIFAPMESETLGEFVFHDLYQRSVETSELARQIAIANSCSPEDVVIAQNAGLFKGVGRLILARYFPEAYLEALDVAKQGSISIGDAEQKVFGVTHVEIGAFLLALWGIAPEIVRSVRAIEESETSDPSSFGPAAAVFVANHLIGESDNPQQAAIEQSEYVRQLDCAQQIPSWRALVKR